MTYTNASVGTKAAWVTNRNPVKVDLIPVESFWSMATGSQLVFLNNQGEVASDYAGNPCHLVRRLKRISGLPWADLAIVLNVSSRTLFNWEAGEGIDGENLEKLEDVLSFIESVNKGNPAYMKHLLRKQIDGESGISLLAKGRFEQVRRHLLSDEIPTRASRKPLPVETREALRPGAMSFFATPEKDIAPVQLKPISGLGKIKTLKKV